MFVGTSPAFDLAMFTTCVLKGRAAGGGTTDCVCEIQDPRLGKSTAEFRTIENSQRKVVTAYPRNVKPWKATVLYYCTGFIWNIKILIQTINVWKRCLMNKRYTNQHEMTLIIGIHRSRSEAINLMCFRHLMAGIWRCRPSLLCKFTPWSKPSLTPKPLPFRTQIFLLVSWI